MAITLTSMPVEVLLQMCQYLPKDSDVSNFRLVCRSFSDIGLPVLGTKVTFLFLPESIARLRDISLHPFFRHHISTLVCLVNMFEPYDSVEDWRDFMTKMERYEDNTLYTSSFSDDDWSESFMHYNTLLAAQGEALKAFEPSKDVDVACQRFTNLQHLEIRDYQADIPLPDHLHSNQAYRSLSFKHGDLRTCFGLPAFGNGIFSEKTAAPGIFLLESLLRATSESQLRALWVDALAINVFDGRDETEAYSQMSKSSRYLRTLKLCICARVEVDGWQEAKRIVFKNRIKTFLCSAPHLEDIELTYRAVYYEYETYYTNIAYILPREYTWSRLRRLRLTNAEIVISIFLDFLSSHGQTLKSLELEDCALQRPDLQKSRWSDIMIPLATTYSLITLSLSGRFMLPQLPGQNQGQNQDQNQATMPPHIHMWDRVQDVQIQDADLIVGDALELVTCSKDFDSFLHDEVRGCKDLIVKIKEGIIQDLMDHDPVKRVLKGTIDIPTRYKDYLKSFALSIYDYDLPPEEWWPDPTDPDRLPFSSVEWSPSWMETLPGHDTS